jgi:hypothetical protein
MDGQKPFTEKPLKRNILLEINNSKVFEIYFEKVLSGTSDNQKEIKNENVHFLYSRKTVKKHKEFFKDCFKSDLSVYKSLVFFGFYLDELEHGGMV